LSSLGYLKKRNAPDVTCCKASKMTLLSGKVNQRFIKEALVQSL